MFWHSLQKPQSCERKGNITFSFGLKTVSIILKLWSRKSSGSNKIKHIYCAYYCAYLTLSTNQTHFYSVYDLSFRDHIYELQ